MDEMANGTYDAQEMKNAYKVLVGKPKGKRPPVKT
jgi:hypothetical protein